MTLPITIAVGGAANQPVSQHRAVHGVPAIPHAAVTPTTTIPGSAQLRGVTIRSKATGRTHPEAGRTTTTRDLSTSTVAATRAVRQAAVARPVAEVLRVREVEISRYQIR